MKITHRTTIWKTCFHAIIAAFILLSASAQSARAMSNADIESTLTNLTEPGYKYIERLGPGVWKVQYVRAGWEFAWEVVVTATSDNPDNSIVVIGATLLSTKSLSSELMLKMLDENSYDTNPGGYAIFTQDDTHYIQYSVKLPQTLITEEVLKEAIGFVAGSANSRSKTLEKLLPKEPASK